MVASALPKKLSGIDLNGVQDFSARNWMLDVEGAEVFSDKEPYINLGSIRSSVIQVETPFGNEFVGGIQADLAPHGLGGGFGQIGRPENRTSLIDLISSNDTETEKLAAAFIGLAPTAAYTIVSIADSPETSEIYQDNLVKALRKNKGKSFLLIWRSVLAVLSQIQRLEISPGKNIGIINHSPRGVDLQTLQIKEAKCKDQMILVPERKAAGITLETNFGYDALFNTVKSHLQSLSSDPMLDVDHSKNLGLIALGQQAKPELVRSATGAWRELRPMNSVLELFDIKTSQLDSVAEFFSDCDLIFFETFTTGQLEFNIRTKLEEATSKKLFTIGGTAIAEAALFAAKRLEQDRPIYFDFLPQISTIVRSGVEARNFDLIDQSETLRAGKVFRSRDPAEFAINPEAERIEVYLRKETEEQPRKSTIELTAPPGVSSKVLISVEQIPALGRATIQVRADAIGLNRNLDWDTAEILEETWQEVIDRQETPVVPIPERLIVPASSYNWSFGDQNGLEAVIEHSANSKNPDWNLLSQRAYSSFSSDGDIPDHVSKTTLDNLDIVNSKAMVALNEILTGKRPKNNAVLKFFTYQYKLCPEKIAPMLLDLWKHRTDTSFSHPLKLNASSWVLIFQGFGRVAFDPELEKKALRKMLDIPIENWRWREQTACMAFLLSRSKMAHRLLDSQDLPILLERVKIEFKQNIGDTYNLFNYTPLLLAGLLRYREINSSFLLLGSDPAAKEIQALLNKTLLDLNRSRKVSYSNREKYIKWITEIGTYMKGEQGNPNLLLDIYNN